MDIEISKLTPDLAEEYAHFFDTTPHDDRIPDHTCYCVCWCSDDHRFWTGGPTREERRAMAIDYVGSGKVQGYLAYSGSRIVGWCNANTKAAYAVFALMPSSPLLFSRTEGEFAQTSSEKLCAMRL